MTPQFPVLLAAATLDLPHVTIGKGQEDDYIPLPALVGSGDFGVVTTRWKLTWAERWKVFLRGRMYFQQITMHRKFQPFKPMIDEPAVEECL